MNTLTSNIIKLVMAALIFSTCITGCAEWNSHPVVVEQNFGHAVNNMIKNQTLYADHGQDDNPVLQMDGRKAEGVIRAYRQRSAERLEQSKQGPDFDVKNVGAN